MDTIQIKDTICEHVIGCSWGTIHIFTALNGNATCEMYFRNDRPLEVHFNRLVVGDGMRGYGIGTALLQYMEDYAQYLGAVQATLAADINKPGLIEWYARCGYEEYDRDGYEIKMVKNI